jgi:hypothetical protein
LTLNDSSVFIEATNFDTTMETYILMCFLFGWRGAPLLHCILDSGKILVLICFV